jgi:hypothetical protein
VTIFSLGFSDQSRCSPSIVDDDLSVIHHGFMGLCNVYLQFILLPAHDVHAVAMAQAGGRVGDDLGTCWQGGFYPGLTTIASH